MSNPRAIVNNLFRGLTLDRNSELWQSLPAEKRFILERSEEYVKIEKERENLKVISRRTSIKERKKLYNQIRKLETTEFYKYRDSQPRNPLSTRVDTTYAMGGLRARFARVSRIIPERERLARGIFLVTILRSPEDRRILNDIITLCK